MAQLSLYLDDATMDDLRKAAQTDGVSLSHYVAALVHERTASGWPEGYWKLYGCIADDTFEAPAQLSFEHDAPRGDL